MIKVCHMTSVHPVLDTRIFYKECTSLANEGYDVYLVAQGESFVKNNVKIVGVGEKPSSRFTRMTSFAKNVYKKALSLDCDIYHFHDPELLPFALKLKKKGKKVIFDSHEKYTEQLKNKPYLPYFITVIIAKIYGVYEKHVLNKIDAVIFPCSLEGKNPFENKCKNTCLINNFPMLNELYDNYKDSEQRYDNAVCYIGSLSYERGITHLIKSCYKAHVTLYLAGEFSTKEYYNSILNMPEYSCVNYLGKQNRTEIISLLNKCKIGAVTLLNVGQYNKFDNLATKAYEYMSMGLPLILTRSPYNEKIIGEYNCGICVDPENVDEIANAIKFLLDNPDEARRMGQNGRRAVKEEFNWGVEEQKLFKLYKDILNS